MDLEVGRQVRVDPIEELAKLDRSMTTMGLRDDRAGLGVERGKQRCRPVALVVVRPTLGFSGPEGQQRRGAIQRLDLRFLIDAQDHRVIGRIQIQAHDVAHLRNQQGVRRELERLAPVRLQAKGAPHATNRHMTEAGRFRHLARAPVRRPPRRRLQRAHNHVLDLRVRDLAGRAGPRFVEQARHTIGHEPRPPHDRPATAAATYTRWSATSASVARRSCCRAPRRTRARAAPVAPVPGPIAIDGPAIPILLVPPPSRRVRLWGDQYACGILLHPAIRLVTAIYFTYICYMTLAASGNNILASQGSNAHTSPLRTIEGNLERDRSEGAGNALSELEA